MLSQESGRVRRTDSGWKITERYIDSSTTNTRLDPPVKSAIEIAPYLPKVLSI
jgi:hypothetical protein